MIHSLKTWLVIVINRVEHIERQTAYANKGAVYWLRRCDSPTSDRARILEEAGIFLPDYAKHLKPERLAEVIKTLRRFLDKRVLRWKLAAIRDFRFSLKEFPEYFGDTEIQWVSSSVLDSWNTCTESRNSIQRQSLGGSHCGQSAFTAHRGRSYQLS